ncbi:MAG: hypothetical protein IPM47_00390 [Sphingobacteriales bacterium]|nr:MAG: hypothetical protein IPM47_00390 [Sphingobacteriales bacterium]
MNRLNFANLSSFVNPPELNEYHIYSFNLFHAHFSKQRIQGFFLCLACSFLLFTTQPLNAQPNTPPITPDIELCSVASESVSFQLSTIVTDEQGNFIVYNIQQLPTGGIVMFDSTGDFAYTPQAIGFQDYFIYTACDIYGACSSGTVFIHLAEMESLPPIEPIIQNLSTQSGLSVDICDGNIGWAWANNCFPNLYTVCITHNESLGQIYYINDNCVYYQPAGTTGTDTIKVVGCGDVPPPMIYTCNGWEQMDICSHQYYIITIEPVNIDFTEIHEISCDSIIYIGDLGYPTWVTPTIIDPPSNGNATIVPDGLWSALVYNPYQGFIGSDTVIVECAEATQITCQTGMYIFNVDCTNNQSSAFSNPVVPKLFYDSSSNNLNIQIQHQQFGQIGLTLFSLSGSVAVTAQTTSITPTAYAFSLPSLPNGIYLAMLHFNGRQYVEKIWIGRSTK